MHDLAYISRQFFSLRQQKRRYKAVLSDRKWMSALPNELIMTIGKVAAEGTNELTNYSKHTVVNIRN
jgi:hypothetical protein